jgi:hypothetical protein
MNPVLILQHAIDHVLRTATADKRFTDEASTDAYYILDRAASVCRECGLPDGDGICGDWVSPDVGSTCRDCGLPNGGGICGCGPLWRGEK